jgi:hypothetical protein
MSPFWSKTKSEQENKGVEDGMESMLQRSNDIEAA